MVALAATFGASGFDGTLTSAALVVLALAVVFTATAAVELAFLVIVTFLVVELVAFPVVLFFFGANSGFSAAYLAASFTGVATVLFTAGLATATG